MSEDVISFFFLCPLRRIHLQFSHDQLLDRRSSTELSRHLVTIARHQGSHLSTVTDLLNVNRLTVSVHRIELVQALANNVLTHVLFLFDLNAKLNKAKNLYNLIEYYARIPVLCLDELGYVIPTKEQADCIFQIFSKRTEVTTTLVTTNLVPSDWGKIFDTVTASAILDRLSLNGKFITFEGRSYRLLKKDKTR